MTRLAWAFFHRDASIALSYRSAFIASLLGNVLLLGIFYYIGQLITPGQNPALAKYGGSYLAFMLIGLALTDCVISGNTQSFTFDSGHTVSGICSRASRDTSASSSTQRTP